MKTTMKDYGPDILANFICEIKKERSNGQPFFLMYTMNLAHSALYYPIRSGVWTATDNT